MNIQREEKIIRELEANQADRLMRETQCVVALSSCETFRLSKHWPSEETKTYLEEIAAQTLNPFRSDESRHIE